MRAGVGVSAERRDLPAVVGTASPVSATLRSALAVPKMAADAGNRAAKRFFDFFAASIEDEQQPPRLLSAGVGSVSVRR
jgi:hypothetical protein